MLRTVSHHGLEEHDDGRYVIDDFLFLEIKQNY